MGSSPAAIAAPSQRTELKSDSFTCHSTADDAPPPTTAAAASPTPSDPPPSPAAGATAAAEAEVAAEKDEVAAEAAAVPGARACCTRLWGCSSTYFGLRLRCVTPAVRHVTPFLPIRPARASASRHSAAAGARQPSGGSRGRALVGCQS